MFFAWIVLKHGIIAFKLRKRSTSTSLSRVANSHFRIQSGSKYILVLEMITLPFLVAT